MRRDKIKIFLLLTAFFLAFGWYIFSLSTGNPDCPENKTLIKYQKIELLWSP